MKLLIAAAVASAALASTAHAAEAGKGEAAFQECAACHSLEAGVNEIGPSLHGLIGRKAGAVDDFAYSRAMKASGVTWSTETLDKFIADPQAAVPGNRMPYSGLASPADRAALVAYLQTATK